MQVGDILRKKTARVATVRMNETVAIAAQLMRASNISALVVKDVVRTEGNTAVGMFTERDVVRAIAEHGAAGERAGGIDGDDPHLAARRSKLAHQPVEERRFARPVGPDDPKCLARVDFERNVAHGPEGIRGCLPRA